MAVLVVPEKQSRMRRKQKMDIHFVHPLNELDDIYWCWHKLKIVIANSCSMFSRVKPRSIKIPESA
eukprot:2953102-Amphidinium_carterae.1